MGCVGLDKPSALLESSSQPQPREERSDRSLGGIRDRGVPEKRAGSDFTGAEWDVGPRQQNWDVGATGQEAQKRWQNSGHQLQQPYFTVQESSIALERPVPEPLNTGGDLDPLRRFVGQRSQVCLHASLGTQSTEFAPLKTSSPSLNLGLSQEPSAQLLLFHLRVPIPPASKRASYCSRAPSLSLPLIIP